MKRPTLFILLLFLLNGCAWSPEEDSLALLPSVTDGEEKTYHVELPDSSCSYFYYLWGIHAENNKQFAEAEEAYEKALICDPDSQIILGRLPILLLRMGKPHGAAKWLRISIERFPENLQDRYLLARIAIRNGETDEAIKIYKELFTLSPQDETILLRMGVLYSDQNKLEEASAAFTKALAVNPKLLFTHLYIARLAAKTGAIERATIFYNKALRLNWSIDLELEVADFYATTGFPQEAILHYRNILKKHPDDHRAGLGLAHTLLIQGKDKQALKELLILRENSTNKTQIDIITAHLHLRSNNFQTAIEVLIPLVEKANEPEASYMLAVIYYQQQQTDKAIASLKNITRDSTLFKDALFLHVRILMELKEANKAIQLIQRAIDKDESAPVEMYTLLASMYMEQGQFEKGYATLDAASTVHPDNTKILFEYGLLLEQEGRRVEAIAQMEKILTIDANHSDALNYIGYTWADLGINLEKALIYTRKATRLKPGNGYIQDSLGWVYFRLGRLQEAMTEITGALRLEPEDPHIHEHLGDIYLQLNEQKKAIQSYNNAIQHFRNDSKKKQVQEKIDALQ